MKCHKKNYNKLQPENLSTQLPAENTDEKNKYQLHFVWIKNNS